MALPTLTELRSLSTDLVADGEIVGLNNGGLIPDLSGKVALITGSSRGLGMAIAEAFAAHGAQIALCARHPSALKRASERLSSAYPGRISAHSANTGRPDDMPGLVDAVLKDHGRIDMLVNNAAASPYYGDLLGASIGAWDKTFEVNVRGPFALIQAVALRWNTGGGSIVNVVSVGGMRPGPGVGVYNISKAALIMLTRQLAFELGPRGIRVNAVAPGVIKTQFSKILWSNPATMRRILATNPMRRIGTPREVAAAALFLASDAASYINGQILVADGGGGDFS